ncbi:hypothetical protein Tco_1187684 [Tanacetum coccineum]
MERLSSVKAEYTTKIKRGSRFQWIMYLKSSLGIMLQRHHKVDDDHHDMPLIYYMEGHTLYFGRRDFSLITGFRFGTDEETFGKLSDEDAVCLCLLLALEVIFMGRLLTFKVDDTLFRLVDNLEGWNSFPWGENLWTHLYDEIKNLKERRSDEFYYGFKKDRNFVPTYTLSGFVFAFQVLANERNDRHAKLQFNDEFSSMTSDLRESLNSIFVDLIKQHDSDEDIAEDNRFRLEEANRLRLEEENMLQLAEQKKKKRKEFMNSSHANNILAKLAPAKRNQVELLLQKGMPLFYANGERYTATTPWSEVDQERLEQIVELQRLVGSNVAAESVRLLRDF